MESSFERLARLFAKDVDETLLRRSMQLTPEQRLAKLMEMQKFMDDAKKARARVAERSAQTAE